MIDYSILIGTINKLIKTETSRLIVPQGNTDEQPAYPFATYTITSPSLPRMRAYNGDTMTTDAEIVISYTWYSKDILEATTLAQQTESLLFHPATTQKLTDAGLSIVRIDGMGSRDTFLTLETERRVGFDVRVRTRHTDTKPIEEIETFI